VGAFGLRLLIPVISFCSSFPPCQLLPDPLLSSMPATWSHQRLSHTHGNLLGSAVTSIQPLHPLFSSSDLLRLGVYNCRSFPGCVFNICLLPLLLKSELVTFIKFSVSSQEGHMHVPFPSQLARSHSCWMFHWRTLTAPASTLSPLLRSRPLCEVLCQCPRSIMPFHFCTSQMLSPPNITYH
jgi:hypothetical protein